MRSLEIRPTEQRDSVRCPVEPGKQACELTIGSARYPATLLDESVSGFAVLAKLPPGAPIRRQVVLGINNRWFRARIVHTSEVEPGHGVDGVAAEDSADAVSNGAWYRMGLLRLEEIDQPFDVRISQSPTKRSRLSRASVMLWKRLTLAGLLLAGLVAAFLLMR